MKKERSLVWLQPMPHPAPHGHHRLGSAAPPDDLPDEQYDLWAAQVQADARRVGAKLVNPGRLG